MTETQVRKGSTRMPLWQLWLTLGLLAVVLGIWIRLSAPGWLLVITGVILLILMVAHPIVQAIAVLNGGAHRMRIASLLLLSDVFFVLGFGFQIDFTDAPGSYMALTSFYYQVIRGLGSSSMPTVPDGLSALYVALTVAFLVGLIVTWGLLLAVSLRRPKENTPGQPPA